MIKCGEGRAVNKSLDRAGVNWVFKGGCRHSRHPYPSKKINVAEHITVTLAWRLKRGAGPFLAPEKHRLFGPR